MSTPLFPFQEESVAFLDACGGRALIGHSMGLGKTLIALTWLQRHPELRPAVVVCPASVKYVWEDQARHHIGVRAEVLSGTKPPRGGLLSPRGLLVLNYDILYAWVDYLRALKPQVVVLDEVHFIVNWTKRTRSTRSLCKKVPHVIALSGTPLINKPSELWYPLNILRPDVFDNHRAYLWSHCAPRRAPWGWTFNGASRLKQLHQKLKPVMIRRRKEDVLSQLPSKTWSVVPVSLSNVKEYEKAHNDFLAWLAEKRPSKVRKALRAEAITRLGYLRRLAARLKLPAVFSWLDDFLEESEGKVVLFAVHKRVIKKLKERYKGQCVVVDGSVVGRDRQKAVDQFLHDPKTRVFLGNVKAAGTGWSAKGVSDVAFVELPWSPGELEQAADRAHGLGRGVEGRGTVVHLLLARGTIEERMAEILRKKAVVTSKVLDGDGSVGGLSVLDDLLTSYQKESK